jgi:hypothetical protein
MVWVSQTTRPPEPEPLWDPQRAGEYLSFTPEYVCKLAKGGILPGKKVGKYWRFVPSKVVAWAESGSGA